MAMAMMPVYFVNEAQVTRSDVEIASLSWKLILNDAATPFIQAKEAGVCKYQSSLEWFGDLFYERFFDVYPLGKPMFSGCPHAQGKLLVMMISTILRQITSPRTFRTSMVQLAVKHTEWGVKPIEYGVFGEVLFWTLRTTLGSGFDQSVELAWIKIYSLVLEIVVPVAIHCVNKGIGAVAIEERDPSVLKAIALSNDGDADAASELTF